MRKNKLVFLLTTLALVACFVTIAFVGCTNPIDKAKDVVDSIVSDGLVVEAVTASVDHEVYLSANTTSTTNGVELTATISPASAANYTLVWTASWHTQAIGGEWSTGKNVNDYVSVTQNVSNQHKATVSALQAFGCPIDVVCSVENTNVAATCSIGYGQRLTNAGSLVFKKGASGETTYLATSQTVLTTDPFFAYTSSPYAGFAENAACRYVLELAFGSIYTNSNTSKSVVISVEPSSGLYAALQARNIAHHSTVNQHVVVGSYTNTNDLFANRKAIFEALTNISAASTNANIVTDVETFNQAVLANQDSYDYQLKAVVITDYESMVYTYNFQFDRTAPAFTVQSISLSQAAIVL